MLRCPRPTRRARGCRTPFGTSLPLVKLPSDNMGLGAETTSSTDSPKRGLHSDCGRTPRVSSNPKTEFDSGTLALGSSYGLSLWMWRPYPPESCRRDAESALHSKSSGTADAFALCLAHNELPLSFLLARWSGCLVRPQSAPCFLRS
jgi:hypothetical protein